jgi:hypothetical protein
MHASTLVIQERQKAVHAETAAERDELTVKLKAALATAGPDP